MAKLPEWATELADACTGYQFATYLTFHGRAVVAERVAAGSGPLVVITSEEREMRAALQVPLSRSSQ